MCTVDDDIDILWETDMLPTPLKTVYMFYLNWQTFIQTSIMCNVNILSINYIAPTSKISSPPTRETFYSANFHTSSQPADNRNQAGNKYSVSDEI